MDKIDYNRGCTNTGAAIRAAANHFNELPSNIETRYMFVITDGCSHDNVLTPSNNFLADENSQIVAVAVGDSCSRTQLQQMTGGDDDKVFSVDSYSNIHDVFEGVVSLAMFGDKDKYRDLGKKQTLKVDPTSIGADCYSVTGAGTAEVNGTYSRSGVYNGYPTYVKNGGQITLMYCSHGHWMFVRNVAPCGEANFFYIATNKTLKGPDFATFGNVHSNSRALGDGRKPYPSISVAKETSNF